MKLVECVKASWKTLVVLLTPVVLCPLVFPYSDRSEESKCAALLILMAVYWITEALPLPVTSLLPLALSPLLGIASSKQICSVFFGDLTFLLLGGIIVAIAIEECQLHRRIALKILMKIGVEPRRLMLGIMVTTAFLSMWISNTATTAMMMPITRALLAKLFNTKRGNVGLVSDGDGLTSTENRRSHSVNSLCSSSEDGVSMEFDVKPSSHELLYPQFIRMRKLNETAISVSVVSNDFEKQVDSLPQELDYDHQHQSSQKEKYYGSSSESKDGDLQEKIPMRQLLNHSKEIPGVKDDEDVDMILKHLAPQDQATLKAFSLCVCYSSSIGGMATLTGTAPNMVLSRMTADMSKKTIITFANWMAFTLPVTVITLLGCYLWMNLSVFGFRNTLTCRSPATKEDVQRAKEAIRQEYQKLGKIRFNEIIVLVHFLVLVGLWLTRDPGSVPGWAVLFKDRFVTDGATAMAVAISLFVFPNRRPNVLFFRQKEDTSISKSSPSILSWKQTSGKFPWGVIFLLGGGFALSETSKVSGFSAVLAKNLLFIRDLPVWTAGLVVTALTSLLTEITSNTVIILLVLPIIKDVAVTLSVNPMYLMLPATLASSLAFMLPVATPPNALVFAYGDVKTIDMIKSGALLNIIGIATVLIATNTWGYAIYNLAEVPLWIKSGALLNIIGIATVLIATNTWGYAIYNLAEVPLWASTIGVTTETANSTVTSPAFSNSTSMV